MTTALIIFAVIVGLLALAILVGKMLDRDCQHCNGTGEIPPNGNEYQIPCPVCNGRGYLI